MRLPVPGVLRRIGWIAILMPAVVVAAAALSYYSYRYTRDLARRGEQSIVDTNRDLAEGLVKRVEQVVVESDRTLFELVDLDNLHQFPRRWSDIVRLSPTIESALILDERQQLVPDGYVSKKQAKEDVDAFRTLFEREIAPDLELASLPEDAHKHLHREYEGRYYLLSYTRRTAAGRSFYIVLEADLAYLVGEVFPEAFGGIDARRMYQVVDEHDRVVFGHPYTRVPARYVVALPFSQTLYKWRFRMAPREAPNLAAREKSRRVFDLVMVVMSVGTVFFGLAVLSYAVRAERRASRLKSDFIANVSHELKTPLSLIRMFGEMLQSGRTKGPESAREYAEIITREAERLTHLIDNVLDFARAERGQSAFRLEVADLGEVVERCVDLCRHRLDREGLTVRLQVAPDLPAARFDGDAMTLVLLNLIDNAIKYAAEGKELDIAVNQQGRRLVVQVQDRGPGIAADERDRVFERFYRARAARQGSVRGSGIGLSLVKHIVEAHGGGVSVESDEGRGTRFTLWLPAADGAARVAGGAA